MSRARLRDKPGGLVVDYLGLADQLKKALITYTESGGQGNPTFDAAQAISVLLEKHGIACELMHGFNWDKWTRPMTNDEFGMSNWLNFAIRTSAFALSPIPAGQEHILEQEDGKKRWIQVVTEWKMSNDEFGMSNGLNFALRTSSFALPPGHHHRRPSDRGLHRRRVEGA